MKNRIIAEMFERMADVLEFKGELPFKVNAYRKASRILKDLQDDIEDIWKADRLDSIPGVGAGLAKKIDEYLKTGRMTKVDEIIGSVSGELIDLMGIQNLGPKTLAYLHREFGVQNLQDLKRVIRDGSLSQLPRIGPQKIENIIKGIGLREKANELKVTRITQDKNSKIRNPKL